MISDQSPKNEALSYQQAGVDIEKADRLIGYIKRMSSQKKQPGVLGGIGGFGALYELPIQDYQQPVLVSGTDGVGTKLKLAVELNKHDTIGIDLVAMCVNDIITLGAKPLFFLDYFATGKLELEQAQSILMGIHKGCELAETALIGGETAEMPGVYQGSDYDLAGFCVGIVEKNKILDGSKQVKVGDTLIGVASSGAHSNGFSLVRHILDKKKISLATPFQGSTLGENLLTPTRIYVTSILTLLSNVPVHAIAHITGGGLLENIPRVLPSHTRAVIDSSSWQWPEIFGWLQKQGQISDEEMYRTFNTGVGMVIAVDAASCDLALKTLHSQGETAWVIGRVEQSAEQNPHVMIA